ncbi:F-box protein At1g78280 [Ricinus communis]|uniref:F-box protein At1g78280 n=1 Tax=Ricinus communis TaxID=3988 RepID=UPI00201AE3AD|nr:F-box protein At1g78280 [Ricinus communis]
MENCQLQAFDVKDRRPEALGNLRVLPDELICAILENLTPRDAARLACVSSVMYVLCNEEPLWMSLCLNRANGPLQYQGSWKKTALHLENVPDEYKECCGRPRVFDGFSSLFLYRRLYRCHTSLGGFSFDTGNVERRNDLSLEEFSHQYDGRKPVLLAGLADDWPARNTWTVDQLSKKYGDTAFKISQRSSRKVSMKFKDYISYINCQHDEDPLYIFDDKFGETAPGLLKDYSVPHLFEEDYFEVLTREQRPPFRWLIIGPERSGASWHVDPALTSAWNTLLCGRKRWALYPPGRVPIGVTVHVNDEDGDVNVDTPSSLQWWLDYYPLLAEEDKPIECTQLPGETIFVPSGWWHCVLNLETTVAVTQNFVNSKNFEYVCLDMAPGYRHKGVCRAGLLALDEGSLQDVERNVVNDKDSQSYADLTRKEKRVRIQKPREDPEYEMTIDGDFKSYECWRHDFAYDIKFLGKFLDEDRDHYNSPWSPGNSIGQREMRGWLSKLWVQKPEMRELIWKGACLALNAGKWLNCLAEICAFHNLPPPQDDEKLPVGTGSNPVYLLADHAVKIFVEGGLEASMYGLGTELEFYSVLHKVNSPLRNHLPETLASGILYLDNGTHRIVPWDGKGVPSMIENCDFIPQKFKNDEFPFGVWAKKQYEWRTAGMSVNEQTNAARCTQMWPFIVTKRCKGKIFAELRETLSWEDALNLASFLGEQLCNLHLLPYPPFNKSNFSEIEQEMGFTCANGSMEELSYKSDIPAECNIFIRTLSKKKKDVISRLRNWGDPIPGTLIQKVHEYIPDDLTKLLEPYQNQNGMNSICKPCSWIHSDVMDDNVHMEPNWVSPCLNGNSADACLVDSGSNGYKNGRDDKSWRPGHIIDFSNLSIGDRIYDLIPVYLDVFRGDTSLLKQFLESYKLPLLTGKHEAVKGTDKFARLSYRAMCYCILHEENILGAIFSIWKELRMSQSWEEVELTVWGELNNYKGIA